MTYSLKKDWRLLSQLVIGPFYRENAGMLAVVAFICFGFFESVPMGIAAHKGIMHEICTNPIVMLVTIGIWLAYAFKTWMFVLQVLRDPQNECLYVMGLAPTWQARILWCLVYVPISLPITVYGSIAAYVGLQSGNVRSAVLILLFHVSVMLIWAVFFHVVQSLAHRRFVPPWRFAFPFSVPLPHFLYFGSHLVQERKLMLLVTKAISLFLLWGGFYLMRVQDLDVRFGLMCMVAATAAHVNIVIKMQEFENHTMMWRRNLPVRPFILFFSHCLFFFLLFLPELLLISKQVGTLLNWYHPFVYLAVGVAGLSHYHSILYKRGMHHEKFMNQVFVAWLLFTFAIQFRLPPLVVSFLLGLYSYWLYSSRYYRYEVKMKNEP